MHANAGREHAYRFYMLHTRNKITWAGEACENTIVLWLGWPNMKFAYRE
ncbi:hypothetical protein [Virgibacillus sp. YIM 98842]|nr:hypothetical protein [Virgibacillus sp. YIM 98842]